MAQKIRGRLAPTPSGYLHLGNLLNFVLNWVAVRKKGGELFLRIDDHDETRTRDHFIEQIFADLDWLGFDWDHGPKNLQEWREQSQAKEKEAYRQQLNKFESHLFACSCSRTDLAGHKRYPGTCYQNNNHPLEHREMAIRLKGKTDDPILWRRDDLPSYHWVSLLEDRENEINLIIRGEDLRAATEIQKEIENILYPNDLIFSLAEIHHHPMILGDDGKKLSKSEGSMALKTMRAQGMTPQDVFRELSHLMDIPVQSELRDFLER